jgi:hypothetical protein
MRCSTACTISKRPPTTSTTWRSTSPSSSKNTNSPIPEPTATIRLALWSISHVGAGGSSRACRRPAPCSFARPTPDQPGRWPRSLRCPPLDGSPDSSGPFLGRDQRRRAVHPPRAPSSTPTSRRNAGLTTSTATAGSAPVAAIVPMNDWKSTTPSPGSSRPDILSATTSSNGSSMTSLSCTNASRAAGMAPSSPGFGPPGWRCQCQLSSVSPALDPSGSVRSHAAARSGMAVHGRNSRPWRRWRRRRR